MIEKNKNLYDEESIQSLSPLEFTRLRPQVYCGSTEYSTQLLLEILSNSIDEFKAGHATDIDIVIQKDVVTVTDNGQGFIPMSYREDGKTILEASFSVLNTSGKFDENGVYEGVSLGLYGIGAKLPIYLSSVSKVCTFRDGQFEEVCFKDGVFEKRDSGKINHPSGTVVQWKPDSQFFTHTEVDINFLKDYLTTISCLCQGLTINLDYNGVKEVFFSKNGLSDYLEKKIGKKELLKNRFHSKFNSGKESIDFILTYINSYSGTIIPYVNTGLTEKGPHISLIKTLITKEFNRFFREQKWLKEKDENLTGDDIAEGQYILFNITASGVAYDAQVKSNVTRLDMKPFISQLTEDLRYWLEVNKKEIKEIADKAIAARKAREAAKKARDAARTKIEKKAEKALKFDSKLADANSKNRSICEIYVTEGDSASGNLKLARDNETQAILPVRGKIINVRKASLDKIQKNAEIMTMIEAFGLSIDPKTMKLTFKPEDLRYSKIIIMSDADVNNSAYERLFR